MDVKDINQHIQSLGVFVDPTTNAEVKVKVAQDISDNLEMIVASSQYHSFLENVIPTFLKFLTETEPYFIAEFHAQQARKLALEIIHRLPANELLRIYVRQILNACFKLLETDNEENVVICLRLIIELHKSYRPPFSTEVQNFLQYVKNVYNELPSHVDKIFGESKLPVRIKDLNELNILSILDEIYSITSFQSEKRGGDGAAMTYSVIPRARSSLKVLQELPIIVVLMYQIYKGNVHQEVGEFIPIVMTTISLQPSAQHRASSNFNKEILVEFMAAQIKTLSFLAYIIKLYQEIVGQHSPTLIAGLINLLTMCPMEVAHLRRELYIATRHIMATELRFKFVTQMERLFDEDILLGKGWTVNETMRSLAYSTLADVIHHVRQHLSFADLCKAVMFFSCHVHDETLPLGIQTMSSKLLFNLVESIRLKSESEGGNGREILIRMLDVLVFKFKKIAQYIIPYFEGKYNGKKELAILPTPTSTNLNDSQATVLCSTQSVPSTPSHSQQDIGIGGGKKDDYEPTRMMDEIEKMDKNFPAKIDGNIYGVDEWKRFITPSSLSNISFAETRQLVKTLVCAIKTISWGIASCKATTSDANPTPTTYKQFTPKETEVYLRLMKWGLRAVDIYAINGPNGNNQIGLPNRMVNAQGIRSKEEKEVLEHFAGAFTLLNTYTFRELFTVSIEMLVNRIQDNSALQVVANNLLANPTTSAVFATILVEYLLGKMAVMGEDPDKSNLYLRLFKLVFGSVSLFPAENEQMLKPHLREIVTQSMELALKAKDPYNYFLLLRALFRSIGGGSHDLLYQEFLPLLPSLLQGLNNLQSGMHKQHMRDLFVELCLTVPVRLSSLLPYLPMLMDPLVSALNGSPTLVSQGLRTLELCVDNLQPEFLYEHIQPVRADLMQALWRTLRTANDSTAAVAYRILGKFGGSNRKMLVEPQKLDFGDKTSVGPAVNMFFQDQKLPVVLPIDKVIDSAISILRYSTSQYDLHYKQQSWGFIKLFLSSASTFCDDQTLMTKCLIHDSSKESDGSAGPLYKNDDEKLRSSMSNALTGLILAAGVKELRKDVYPFLIPFVRHLALISVIQQTNVYAESCTLMDPNVFFDAVVTVLGNEEKETKRHVIFIISIFINTIINVQRTKEKACLLPVVEYLTEKVSNLCYERPWYTKLGGCQAIQYFLDHMPIRWVFTHTSSLLKAMFFVLTDLTGEVSSGTIDIAKDNIKKIISLCVDCNLEEMSHLREKSLNDITLDFIKQVTSPIRNIREQSMKGLEYLAETQGIRVYDIMQPHREVLVDMIPPKKHLIRHQSIQSQLGLLDGNTFCLSIRPRLFSMDLSQMEHRVFVSELVALSEADDSGLSKLPCYKNVNNLATVRASVMNVLACTIVSGSSKEKVVNIFLKGLLSTNTMIQQAAFQCLDKFTKENPVEPEMGKVITTAIRPILQQLTNMRTVTVPVLNQLGYMYQLFPLLHPDKVWEQLLQILRKSLEISLVAHSKTPNRSGQHELKLAVGVLSLFPLITPMQTRFLEPLCKLCLQAEKALLLGSGCPLSEPLIKFITKQPNEYVDLVFSFPYVQFPEWNRFFLFFLQQKTPDGLRVREAVMLKHVKILNCINIKKSPPTTTPNPLTPAELGEIQYFGIKTMQFLVEHNPDWLQQSPSTAHNMDISISHGADHQLVSNGTVELIKALREIWENPEYHQEINGGPGAFRLQVQNWKEAQIIAQLLLTYYERNVENLDLLFNLLRAFTTRTVVQFKGSFHFLKDFLEKSAANYPVHWKRSVFFSFVEVFKNRNYPEELKAKIIQCILVPCMTNCFENGQGDEFIGSTPNPEHDTSNNIVSVFLSQVVDPENPNTMPDSIRILLCQMSCILVEHASAHIHDATNKKQGNKLRRLMTFAWPCLLSKTCVDSSTKYYGHLLLSHIISKFAIHKRIVLQVFHSLLKASNPEAKAIVKQALEIITPALPLRMEDGNTMLIHWTKKILVEEGHSLPQLMHILQLIVRHWRVYYPVRPMLITHMVNSIQRLGFTATSTFDHKKLAVELAEVIIKWELERIRMEDEDVSFEPYDKKQKHTAGSLPDPNKPLDKIHTDSVVNFLMRMACSVNEVSPTPGSPGEVLSKRCVSLVKMVIKPIVWPKCEMRLAWFDKLFATLDSAQVNHPNICTAFELLTYLIDYLDKDQLLEHFKLLQKGLILSMNSQNSKVIRTVHTLLVKLMSVFPTDYPSMNTISTKHDELESLYSAVNKIVIDGLNNYEKLQNANPSSLFGCLMLLKAACANNPCYIDRIITQFIKVLQKITKEHMTAGNPDLVLTTELLILGLDLVKNRVGVMGVEMRKAFIGTILVSLIEKTNDPKLMTAIIKMVEEWMKNKNPIVINQGPNIREKSILLVKLMQNVEKRFVNDQELLSLFLEVINYIYKDDNYRSTELNSKLECAFLSGLRCHQPSIRQKFFQVFDHSLRRKLHERLMYILCSQNWESMGSHYWIKQAVEILFTTCMDVKIDLAPKETVFPSPIAGLNRDPLIKEEYSIYEESGVMTGDYINLTQTVDFELNLLSRYNEEDDEDVITRIIDKIEDLYLKEGWNEPQAPITNIKTIIRKQRDFQSVFTNFKLPEFMNYVVQLCHVDTNLAEKMWIAFFPRVWKIFSERQQVALGGEMVPFLCSGIHVIQQNCQPSAINTFTEAISQCVPVISINPTILFYLSKSHNLWHRMALLLEQMALDTSSSQKIKLKVKEMDCYDFEPCDGPNRVFTSPQVLQQETYDSLSHLYTTLKEDDLWAGLWQKRAKYTDTAIGISYEQQGYYEKAQTSYEAAMAKNRAEYNLSASPQSLVSEMKLWEEHWVKCSKELNQWDTVQEYSSTKGGVDAILLLDTIWRTPHWTLMKETLTSVEAACPKDFAWKLNLYRGYLILGSNDEQNLNLVERYVEAASTLCIKEWRRLPQLVSNVHVPILQAAQQIVELHEAMQIHQGMIHGRTNSLHEMKAVVKTWRNRLPSISDDLSHWSDIFAWRQIHYQFIANQNQYDSGQPDHGNQTMLGVHASAQAICHFGKIARKQNLPNVCLEALSKIYSIPSVPIVDCFAKIKQQVKCYIQQAQVLGRGELSEALEIVESTNLKYFSKEMTSEFFALKGLLLCQIGRADDANKSFSASCQLNDALAKCWGFWGDYLENTFTRDQRLMTVGVAAITSFMHACRHQIETKARKYIAKILWLMMYDDEKGTLADAVDKYSMGVPPIQWLPWVPQLLTALVRHDGKMVLNLLNQVGRMYPQAVYFPIRTLYLTLKIEQREKSRSAELAAAQAVAQAQAQALAAVNSASTIVGGIKMEFDIPTSTSSGGGLSSTTSSSTTHVTSQIHSVPPPNVKVSMPSSMSSTTTAPSTPSPSVTTSVPESPATPSAANTNVNTMSTINPSTSSTPTGPGGPEQQAIKATPSMWRCSRIMHMQRDLHPTVLSSLEGIVDQIIWFRENWYEEVVRQLRIGLAKCYAIAFENRSSVLEATITPQLQNFVRKLVSTFGHGSQVLGTQVVSTTGTPTIEALLRRSTIQDPNFYHMKLHFTVDFDSSVPGALKLHNLIQKLRKWIKILEVKTKGFAKSFILEDRFKFLFNFSIQIAEIELPGEFLIPKHAHYYVKIARFQPKIEVVHKHNTSARRIYIRGHNGKIYPYLIVNDSGLSDARREERVMQMIRMCNLYLGRQKVTSRRNLRFTVPKVVAVSPQMRLVEDNPSSMSLLDVFKYGCSKRSVEFDAAITRYYERIATTQAKGAQVSHQVLREILRDIQANIVPRTMLKEWALNNFTTASDYWIFRKSFTLSLCLAGFAEYAFHLTRLNPEMMYLHQDSGLVNIAYFKFDIDDVTGELESNRPVPFRLTPNISEFLTTFGVNGPMVSGMISLARCLVFPNYKFQSILRAILRDEYICWLKKKQDDRDMMTTMTMTVPPGGRSTDLVPVSTLESDSETVINMVNKSVSSIMNRIQSLASFDGSESKVSTLVLAANSHDNLCRMDPAWQPWL